MKLWGGRFQKAENRVMEEFNSSFPFDQRLYRQDITGSMAHARMLGRQGIISDAEAQAIIEGLRTILEDIEEGRLALSGDHEDIHTFVEAELTARIGEAGKKLHTGRSRNDQVALDMRLYARSAADELIAGLDGLIDALQKTGRDQDTIMPGYTHMQRAQAVTFHYYLQAYVSMFRRDRARLENSRELLNESPLGCAALAGTTHNIDRRQTAEELCFRKPVDNFLDGVSDRDYLVELLSDMSLIMVHLSRLSEELILWSSQEFGFVSLSDEYSTGSSIMPQKKNPDACELIRGKAGRVFGHLSGLLTTLKGLPLAYNKDMQEDKEAFFDAYDQVVSCLQVMTGVIDTLQVNQEKMRLSVKQGFLNATEVADYLVGKQVPFRDAHGIVGRIVLACEERGSAIEDLTLEELRAFDGHFDQDIYDYIDYRNILQKGNKREML
ncbi:MAG: argininosuccinate lyase [Firmicutes bacterium]|nr:argininosuccinate lyase [Bacillota bacterium]